MQPEKLLSRMPIRLANLMTDIKGSLRLLRDSSDFVMPGSTPKLDDEYRRGRWDYLAGRDEEPRYQALASYCLRKGGAVLDLGCGEGLLLGWIRSDTLRSYVGIDLSPVAIERAWQRFPASEEIDSDQSSETRAHELEAADIAEYIPRQTFDSIVFNEVLYYFNKPDQLLSRYAAYLKPDGLFLISLWDCPEAKVVWRKLKSSIVRIDETTVRNDIGTTWRIVLCSLVKGRG